MIILLGFPKTASMSFDYLFTQLGLKSLHWSYDGNYIGYLIYQAKRENKPLLYYFNGIDAITEMNVCIYKEYNYWPQLELYKELYEQNQDSIFILNRRDPYKLLESWKNWGPLYTNFTTFNPDLLNKYQGTTDEKFIQMVNDHYNNILNYFKDIPDAKFIEYNIDTDTIDKLKPFIDIKDITELPHIKIN